MVTEPTPLEIVPPPKEAEKPKPQPKLLDILVPIAEKLEEEYRKQKTSEIEDLHNALVDVIDNYVKDRKIHISHILTALEIIKHELIIESLRREGLIRTG